MKLFTGDFFEQDTGAVARALLGHYLCHETTGGMMVGAIVETEAYLSVDDPACHASRGLTERNAAMFGPAGRAYIYLIYGCHYCFNVVTGPVGSGEAVLVRAVEPLEGSALMRQRRGLACSNRDLTSGPGKLCQAFGLDRSFNGCSLHEKPLYLAVNNNNMAYRPLQVTPRIGVTTASDRLLRFIVKDNPFLSRR